jgi:hypothetical protein
MRVLDRLVRLLSIPKLVVQSKNSRPTRTAVISATAESIQTNTKIVLVYAINHLKKADECPILWAA